MKLAEDIIKKPFITEKSNIEVAEGKYTFVVDKNATKTEIKKAVEKLFQVKVLKVNTLNFKGKRKRMGVHEGQRPDWKKAIVKIDTDPKPVTYIELMQKYNYSEDELLSIEDISAYLFTDNTIRAIEVNRYEGIIAETFDKVINSFNESSDEIFYTLQEEMDCECWCFYNI